MIIGPDEILHCPHCKGELRRRTMISGNTFGAYLWSDGYMCAPMMMEMDEVVRCAHCQGIFWVVDAERSKDSPEHDWWDDVPVEHTVRPDLPLILRLDEAGLRKALQHLCEEDEPWKERHLRLKLWWTQNDHYREPASLVKSRGKVQVSQPIPERTPPDRENVERLFAITGNDEDGRLAKAAILLALERFDEVPMMLFEVIDVRLSEAKRALLAAAERKDKGPFRIR